MKMGRKWIKMTDEHDQKKNEGDGWVHLFWDGLRRFQDIGGNALIEQLSLCVARDC